LELDILFRKYHATAANTKLKDHNIPTIIRVGQTQSPCQSFIVGKDANRKDTGKYKRPPKAPMLKRPSIAVTKNAINENLILNVQVFQSTIQ
jgi:hypothetical protein